jgi:hypothetical protein
MKDLIWIVGLSAITTNTVYGGLVLQQSLLSLAQTADLIVVGSASGTFTVGPPVSTFSLTVSRVVSGPSLAPGAALAVQWNNNGFPGMFAQPGDSLAVSGTGLWFLKRTGSGWSLLQLTQGAATFEMTYFPTSISPLASVYAYATTASLVNKLASELSAAIESLNGDYNQELYGLFGGDLDQLKSPVTQVLYQRLSTSASIPQQILGLSGLIRSGSVAGLTPAVSASRNVFANYALEYGILLSSVSNEFRSSDASSIAVLGSAAVDSTNPNPAFREAAAHALAALHTAPTLPYLATLLSDPNSALRIEAIGGMSSFANGLPIQTPAGVASMASLQLPANAPYKTPETVANFAMGSTAMEANETSYLSFWKGWWAQNQASLGF